jgi:hypothetical protein
VQVGMAGGKDGGGPSVTMSLETYHDGFRFWHPQEMMPSVIQR